MEQPLSSIPENIEDYYGEDGLLYCGKCYTPKEAFFAKGIVLMGKNKHPVECCCQRMEREKQEALINQQKHLDLVRRLKAEGFLDPAMLDWTFENDNGRSPQMHHAHHYVEQWQTMRSENLGLLLWGGVGTGKSFLAGCIANALMEQEVPVRMTNFARILNELNGSFSGRNDIVDKFCRYPLLIIDDFGMERGTEYALEQIYSIVDSRYRSRKPLIVTTNLTLDEIRHPQDTAHARIYDLLMQETHDFDRTIGAIYEWAAKDGETLVVVTADHETGGLTLVDGDLAEGRIVCKFSTGGHSGVMVPVYAFGPGAEEFTGIFENTAIFDKIKKLLNL